jgi:hypothetical protein
VTSAPPAPAPAPRPATAAAIKKGGKKGKGKGKDLAKFANVAAAAAAAPAAPSVAAAPAAATAPRPAAAAKPDADEITWPRRLRWIGLAAVPSSLMLGVTVYMSTDISAIPLFWVLPLALYLFSFILVFMRWPINWLTDAHQTVLYVQPWLLAGLVLFMAMSSAAVVVYLIAFMLLAFFTTALACHGEMARDRPSAKHLTEFYLMMSVGGAIGGLFNGMIAPVIFQWGVVEFGLALFVAGILRPKMFDIGWTEKVVDNMTAPSAAGHGGHGKHRKITKTSADTQGLTGLLDFALPAAVLGLAAFTLWVYPGPNPYRDGEDYTQKMFFAVLFPAVCTALLFGRNLRFGLALGALLLLTGFKTMSTAEFNTRSYFGLLRVQRSEAAWGTSSAKRVPYLTLMHGTTNHGMALQRSEDAEIGDLSRTATTYYHRRGPVGVCMERYNWFSDWISPPSDPLDFKRGEQGFRRFDSDSRIITSLIGSMAPVLGANAPGLPAGALVAAWSEPPYAVIGLGTGTMASYGRPYQTVHFYEIDEQIRQLSLPSEGRQGYFGYLKAALDRGTNVKVLMGDARLRMAMPWVPEDEKGKDPSEVSFDKRGGPEHFYHLMVVDAFSSDAIPRHLLTREAMEMYMKHLAVGYWLDLGKPGDPGYRDKNEFAQYSPTNPRPRFKVHDKENKIWVPGGVLCVHTSNRHLKLVPVVVDTAATAEWDDIMNRDASGKPPRKTGLVAVRGHDSAPGNEGLHKEVDIGHFTSEWVMVARDMNDLWHLKPPPNYTDWIDAANSLGKKRGQFSREEYWQAQTPTHEYKWTDDHSNLMAVFRWPWEGGRH